MKPDGRLLIVETVLPPGDTPHQGKVQDMVMLVCPAARSAPKRSTSRCSARPASA